MTHKKLINMAMSIKIRRLMVELRDKYSFHDVVVLFVQCPYYFHFPKLNKNGRRNINSAFSLKYY